MGQTESCTASSASSEAETLKNQGFQERPRQDSNLRHTV